MQPEITKKPLDVQRAHDMLEAVILDGDLRRHFFSGEDTMGFIAIRANCDVLCWLLGHEHNHTFERNLERVESELTRMGFALVDSGSLQVPEDLPAEAELLE